MLTLEAHPIEYRPRPDLIPYPKWPSELHTQTRLLTALETAIDYHLHHDAGRYQVCGNVKARPTPIAIARAKAKRQTARNCYLDLVVFDGPTARILIEIKRQANPTGMFHRLDLARAERQCDRYAAYGLPVLLCWGPEDIPETVAETVRLLGQEGA